MKIFGTTARGEKVHAITVQAGDLMVTVLTYGARLQDVRLAGAGYSLTTGSDKLADYEGACCDCAQLQLFHDYSSCSSRPGMRGRKTKRHGCEPMRSEFRPRVWLQFRIDSKVRQPCGNCRRQHASRV